MKPDIKSTPISDVKESLVGKVCHSVDGRICVILAEDGSKLITSSYFPDNHCQMTKEDIEGVFNITTASIQEWCNIYFTEYPACPNNYGSDSYYRGLKAIEPIQELITKDPIIKLMKDFLIKRNKGSNRSSNVKKKQVIVNPIEAMKLEWEELDN